MKGTGVLWLLSLGLLSHAAVASLTSQAAQLFGEQWIAANGVKTRQFRIYIAQDGSMWDGWSQELTTKRAQFRSDMQQVLASYLEVNLWRISFVSDQLPAQSGLHVPSTHQRDPRSYVDVTIDYPADNQFNTYPWDITSGASWVTGGTTDVSFAAKWGIGVAVCDPLDPDYAFTEPFPGGRTCDRQQVECVTKYPLCNRVEETFKLPGPPVSQYYTIHLNGDYYTVFANNSKAMFSMAFATNAVQGFMSAMPEAQSPITVSVISITPGSIAVNFGMSCDDCNMKKADTFMQYASQADSSVVAGSSLCQQYGINTSPPDDGEASHHEESSHEEPNGCPKVRGYASVRARDHKGDILGSYTATSLRKLARKCDKDCSCQAFTSYGDLKSSSVDDTDAPQSVCFYVRQYPCNQGQCQEVNGYFWIPGRDHSGNTIGYQGYDVQSMANQCDKTCTCKGFNSWGYLKSDASDNSNEADMCLYVREGTCDGCQDIEGYKYMFGYSVDATYNITQVTGTLEDVANACDEEDTCVSFTRDGWLRSSSKDPIASPGTCLYYRYTEEGCEFLNGYTFTHGDSVASQYDLTTTANSSLQALGTACDQDPACKAFALNDDGSGGQLKSSDQPIPSNSTCLYIKDQHKYNPCSYQVGFHYEYGVSVDSQYDMGTVTGSMQDVSLACFADRACKAFVPGDNSTYGVLKSSDVRNASAGSCTYLRGDPIQCTNTTGYKWQGDVTIDSRYDIETRSGSPQELAAACDQTFNCQAFVMLGATGGILKSSNTTILSTVPTCTYIKDTVPQCVDTTGYSQQGAMAIDDQYNLDTLIGGAQDLANACDQSFYCRAFVMDGPNSGTLKASSVMTASAVPTCAYLRDQPCADLPGYHWLVDGTLDHNITTMYGAAENLAAACDQEYSCLGFEMDGPQRGVLKSSNTTTPNAVPTCVYIKTTSPQCPDTPGYIWQAGLTIDAAYDIHQISGGPSLVAAACRALPECKGFIMTGPSNGVLKSSNQTIPSAVPTCTYLKSPPNCTNTAGYQWLGYMTIDDVYDMTLLTGTPEDLAAACDQSFNCLAFVMDGTSQGVLKSSNMTIPSAVPSCAYLKDPAQQCFDTEGYEWQGGVTIDAQYDLETIEGTPQDLAAACSTHFSCLAFVMVGPGKGTLKSSSVTVTSPVATCAYLKTDTQECTEVNGYIAMPDTAIADQYNMGIVGGGPQALADACTAQLLCQGFVMLGPNDGSLKSVFATTPSSVRSCAYMKIPPPCLNVTGYHWQADSRVLPQYDLTPVTPATLNDVAAACNSDVNCKAFSTDIMRGGTLKSSTITMHEPNTCTYIKDNIQCANATGYTWQNTNFTIDSQYDLVNITGDLQAVATACDANAACQAFVMDGSQLGILKSSNATVLSAVPICTYLKTSPACLTVAGYHWQADSGVSSQYNLNPVMGSLDSIVEACDLDINCQALSLDIPFGATLKSSTITVPDPSTCTYIKDDIQCANATGYTWQNTNVTIDSQYDLVNATGGLQAVAAACDANSSCLAFVMDGSQLGILKSSNATVPSAVPTCTYLKDPAPAIECTDINTNSAMYSAMRDMAIADQYNMGTVGGGPQALADACSADHACQGFVMLGPEDGTLKSVFATTPSPVPTCAYMKIPYPCVNVNGYHWQADSRVLPQYDLTRATPATLDDIAATCNSDVNCQAFSTDIMLYSTLESSTITMHAPLTCTFIKDNIQCANATGYTWQNTNFTIDSQYDLVNITGDLQAVTAACDANPACQAFVMDGSQLGTLKSSKATLTSAVPTCTYLKDPSADPCPVIDGYTKQLGVTIADTYNNDAPYKADAATVAANCDSATIQCKAFVMDDSGQGTLKMAALTIPGNSTTCTYIKDEFLDSPCQDVSTLIGSWTVDWNTDMDSSYDWRTRDDNLYDASYFCDYYDECGAFDDLGVLKKSTAHTTITSDGRCLYVKTPGQGK